MTILCYHEVAPDWDSTLNVEPGAFEAHCEWLARRRTVVPSSELAARIESGSGTGSAVALTFDDGYQGVLRHATPIMERLGIPSTVFVVARTVEDRSPVDWVDGDGPVPDPMDADELVEASERGVTIGSHSLAHRDLPSLTEAECVDDLRQSREILEELLGKPVTELAYPRGRHAPHVRAAAAKAGFEWSYGLPEVHEPVTRHSIPRVGVYPGNGVLGLATKTAGWYQRIRLSPAGPMARAVVRTARRAVPS